jgi:hypothetical protein
VLSYRPRARRRLVTPRKVERLAQSPALDLRWACRQWAANPAEAPVAPPETMLPRRGAHHGRPPNLGEYLEGGEDAVPTQIPIRLPPASNSQARCLGSPGRASSGQATSSRSGKDQAVRMLLCSLGILRRFTEGIMWSFFHKSVVYRPAPDPVVGGTTVES